MTNRPSSAGLPGSGASSITSWESNCSTSPTVTENNCGPPISTTYEDNGCDGELTDSSGMGLDSLSSPGSHRGLTYSPHVRAKPQRAASLCAKTPTRRLAERYFLLGDFAAHTAWRIMHMPNGGPHPSSKRLPGRISFQGAFSTPWSEIGVWLAPVLAAARISEDSVFLGLWYFHKAFNGASKLPIDQEKKRGEHSLILIAALLLACKWHNDQDQSYYPLRSDTWTVLARRNFRKTILSQGSYGQGAHGRIANATHNEVMRSNTLF
ncbi:hypothetical protein DFJ73DRAFT_189129 [Zopfochytrium polystomum]|nr:hypothetical protein DFJ73DRAFT_189129 [Zopfochytrium polystomum]